jgi:deoxyribodipyrimidine photo-lyase
MKHPVVVHWFRRDLRLNDNAALAAAHQSGLPVRCIFIFDTDILSKLENTDDSRVTFLHQCIQGIDQQLKKHHSNLHVFIGKPMEIWQKLLNEWNIESVYVNRDYEPYAKKRDEEIFEYLRRFEISFKGKKDHVIFEKNEITKSDGLPYTVFTPYSKKWKEHLRLHPEALNVHAYEPNFDRSSSDGIPSLDVIGFKKSSVDFPDLQPQDSVVSEYAKNRDFPAVQGTTRIGLHLRFGTLSIREMVKKAMTTSEKWLDELIWREFYQMILYHFPHTTERSFKPAYDRIEWNNDESQFERWCAGKTGYPIVDAGMRELNETGFMHNRVRMIVASFLCKHLLIDWRKGERYFASRLLDFELASNVGGWQWVAGSGCDGAPYFRIFNPTSQAQKFDPDGKYIQLWVKELNSLDYPAPIVQHEFARKRCLDTYLKALK